MGYVLSISTEASNNVHEIVNYLKREWTYKSVLKFENELIKCFENILERPENWLLIDKEKGIRKYKISKHNSAFYRLKENEIEVIAVFDHRRDPKKLNKLFDKLL